MGEGGEGNDAVDVNMNNDINENFGKNDGRKRGYRRSLTYYMLSVQVIIGILMVGILTAMAE